MPIKISLKGKASWRRSSSIVVGFEGYCMQGWGRNRASQPSSSRGENEKVSSVRGQRYGVECLETRPGCRKVGTAVGADPSLSRLSVHTTNMY